MGYDTKRLIAWLGIAVSAACGDTSQGSGAFAAPSGSDQVQVGQCGEPGVVVLRLVDTETVSLDDLDCPQGGATAPIKVVFGCDEITVISCKDLSNVVIELADGSRQRFEGLSGHQAVFSATGARQGADIVGVWVKAGSNHSGDGPGYGQRFDAPAGSCDPTNEPPRNPPGDNPPGDNPPGDNPPGDNPPGDNPPGDNPPGDNPPGDNPPGDSPPGDDPPGENDPPGEQDPPCVVNPPPAQDPPSQEPPSGGDDPVVVF